MSLLYFDGIKFIGHGSQQNYSASIKKRFSNYYGIQYHHKGTLKYSVNHGSPQIVSEPCAFISQPGNEYEYGPANEGTTRHHSFVCFSGERVEQFLKKELIQAQDHSLINISKSHSFFSNLIELHECLEQTPQHYERAIHLLEGLLLQLKEERHGSQETHPLKSKIQALGSEIKRKPGADWNFQLEAKKLHISLMHFRRMFKKYLHSPPTQYLLSCRVQGAAGLLRRSNLSLELISHEMGFCDIYHFSKVFKGQLSIPPATYRREFR